MDLNSQLQGRRVKVTQDTYHPAYVVWELTLRCDHACRHCGSRALKPRADELTTTEALAVVEQLSAMGTREVVLIGGEAYLHEGFLTIVAALKAAGITPVMTSGGMGITRKRAEAMAAAGLQRVSISVDGLAEVHGQIRRRPDSFAQTTRAIQAIQDAGMIASANTHFNRLNLQDLEGLYEHLLDLGINSWQVQITAALGRAADHPEMLFQPWDLLDFLPRLSALKRRGFKEGLLIMPGNNLGYFGPEEAHLRSPLSSEASKDLPAEHFQGCQAGKFVMGIESQGAVKGCPSLQSTYVGGNLRQQSLAEIWEHSDALAFRREPIELWGFCASCPFGSVCQGGCNFTAHALFGKPGNNPYCHFRARSLQKQGLRERLVPQAEAPGQPFDHRLFELVTEAFDSEDPTRRGERALPMV
jgi:radical SAM protein with 4Fe4S-binding SPASM domain